MEMRIYLRVSTEMQKHPRTPYHLNIKLIAQFELAFMNAEYSEDIKRTYELRNLAHIETEASKQFDVEIEQSKHAYWRLAPFLEDVTAYLAASNA